MNLNKNNSLTLIAIFMVTFFVLLSYIRLNNHDNNMAVLAQTEQQKHINGFLLPKPIPVADVNFAATHAKWHSNQGFKNKWTLLALGYIQCPDVCPTTLLKLDHVIADIDEKNRPNVAFLSIDIPPENIATLADYMNYFNKDFVGLATKREQLDRFFKQLGASYSISNGSGNNTGDDNTTNNKNNKLEIEHSSAIFLISPEQNYVASFPYMLDAQQIINDYLAIIAR